MDLLIFIKHLTQGLVINGFDHKVSMHQEDNPIGHKRQKGQDHI